MEYFLGHIGWRSSKELQAETSKVVVPGDKSMVHLQSAGKTVGHGKQKRRLAIEDQLVAAKFSNRHVCHGRKLDCPEGMVVNLSMGVYFG